MLPSMSGTKIAVILAGAVAKGAFEAAALDVLARRNVQVIRIVGASSGSLNATLLASGVCAGRAPEAASKLVQLWEDEATLTHVFDVNARDLLQLRGFSDQDKLLRLLSSNIKPCAAPRAVGLRLVVAALNGAAGTIGSAAATTYERVFKFDERDFENDESLARVFRAAAASASFPGAFAPFDPGDGAGPCVDGGTVNNTPIKYALEGDGIDAVVVIAPTVQVAQAVPDLRGPNLGGHLADMLINERLYRDLHEAEDVNRGLRNLAELGLPQATLEQVKAAIGWTNRKPLDIVTIRPLKPLPGNAFSGFASQALRKQYIALGKERAIAALGTRWT
jgi:NTE family protein